MIGPCMRVRRMFKINNNKIKRERKKNYTRYGSTQMESLSKQIEEMGTITEEEKNAHAREWEPPCNMSQFFFFVSVENIRLRVSYTYLKCKNGSFVVNATITMVAAAGWGRGRKRESALNCYEFEIYAS